MGDAVYPGADQERRGQNPGRERGRCRDHGELFGFRARRLRGFQASFFYSREDRARFAGMDSALRENLSMALADGLDKEVVAGGDRAAERDQPVEQQRASAVTTFAGFTVRRIWPMAAIDGTLCCDPLRSSSIVMGAGDLRSRRQHSTGARATSVDRTVLDRLMELPPAA